MRHNKLHKLIIQKTHLLKDENYLNIIHSCIRVALLYFYTYFIYACIKSIQNIIASTQVNYKCSHNIFYNIIFYIFNIHIILNIYRILFTYLND